MLSTHHTNFQYKLAFTQSNSPCSVRGTALPIMSALNQLISGILLITRFEKLCRGSKACSAGRSFIRLAVGMYLLQKAGEPWAGTVDSEERNPVTVAEEAVPEV